MADMTKKHHHLISDAVVRAAVEVKDSFRLTNLLRRVATDINPSEDRCRDYYAPLIAQLVVKYMSESLSKSLRYTNDNFDAVEFRQGLATLAKNERV